MRSLNKLKEDGWETSTVDDVIKDYGFMERWLKDIAWGGCRVKVFLHDKEGARKYMLLMFTEKHQFDIIITPTYMGCQMDNRYCEPFEDWTRGRDLADGKCNEETLGRILCDIINKELVIV